MSSAQKLINDLKKRVGKQIISEDIYERASHGQDTSGSDLDVEKIPMAVVKPSSAQQVSQVVKFANQHNIPIYIHGAGTAFKGSPRPKLPGSLVLSMLEFNSFEMFEGDMYFEAGAGLNQYELEKKLKKLGYFLPMNIGSKYSATIGGAVAINTIGHMVDICLGRIIDYVMGLEVVLPNGEIIETGTRSIRRPGGIDYTRFFVGSEGLFGIVTKVRIRLLPDFHKAHVVGFFPKLSDIGRAFIRYYKEKLSPPLYGELLDKSACLSPFRLRGLGEPKGHMALAINIAHSQEEVDRQAEETVRVFKAEKAIEAFVVTSAKEQSDYWDSRDNILNILQANEEEDRMVRVGSLEAAMPLSHLAEAIDYLKSGHPYSTLHEAKPFIYGHVGTCDLHGMWAAPSDWPVEKRRQAVKETYLLESEINLKWGCVSGEIGQTADRIPFLKKRYGEAAFSVLTGIKKAMDPNNILNPGNLNED